MTMLNKCFSTLGKTVLTTVAAALVALLLIPAQMAAGQSLTVALYPYVPRFDQFKTAIQSAWSQVEPNVQLIFVAQDDWDGGYNMDPSDAYDVYVFDSMFFEYFRAQGWLVEMQPNEIENAADFVAYARTGVQVGGVYYAIPLLGCANILFYDASDTELAEATKLSEINAALSQCSYTSEVPPDVRGLMIDMAGGTTTADLYLDTAHSLNGIYPLPLPQNQGEINQTAIANMRQMMTIASYWNATTVDTKPYERAIWFGQGYGRAVVGFTESMSAMGAAKRANIGFKVMPLSDDVERSLFYADVIGINTSTNGRGTRALSVKLANLMAASATVVASTGPGGGVASPQYLMPTRISVFETLAEIDPIYTRMYELIEQTNPLTFKLNATARSWLNAMKNTIRGDSRADYTCGCDRSAVTPIANNAAAGAICTTTCAANGGWNGQWTNAPPAAPGGESVCGCKACPVAAGLRTFDATPRPHY